MLNLIDLSKTDYLYLPDDAYQKVVEHLEVMNNWKYDPDVISRFPYLRRDFTLADSLVDLLMKGVF